MDFQKFLQLPAFELLSQKESIALLNAREKELVRALDTGESGRLWFDLREICDRIEEEGDIEQKLVLLDRVVQMVIQGAETREGWNEAVFIMRQRDALVQTEQRQQKLNADYMHIDDVMGVVERIGQVVMRHVQEPRLRDAITRDIDAIIAQY